MAEFDEKNKSSFPSQEPFDEESVVTCARTPVPVSPLPHPQKDAPTTSVYPDGGLQANLTVLGAFIALFCTFGQMNAFGTFQAWYASHQLAGLNPSIISWIGSLQLWIFFFSGFAVGRLFDEYGPKWLMGIGTVCYFASIMLTSMCVHYYQYVLAQGVLFGLGVGLLFYPSLSSVSTHFSKYRATAIGIASAGSSFGGVAYSIMLERLFHEVGFGWGVRISGFVSGAGCVVATILTSSHLRSKATCPGFAVKAIRDLRFILLAAGGCFVALGLFIPYFYIVDYARNFTRVDHLSLYVLAVMNAGGVLGRIAPAYVSDCIGRFNLLIPAAFFSGLSCIVLWLGAQTITQILFFCALYGFFSGAFISLVNPCVAQISDMQEIGTRIGLLYTFISFPSLVGGPTAGILLGHHHTYIGAIIFSGCTTMCGSLLIFASKFVIDRRILARV